MSLPGEVAGKKRIEEFFGGDSLAPGDVGGRVFTALSSFLGLFSVDFVDVIGETETFLFCSLRFVNTGFSIKVAD